MVETGSDSDAFNPEIAVDSSGKAIAVWETNFGGSGAISANRFVPGVGWGEPETVGYIDRSDPLEAVGRSRTPIAADDFGNMHLVWQNQRGLYPGDTPADGVYTNRFGGGGLPNGKLVTETLFADSDLADCVIAQAAANSWDFAQEVTLLDCANQDIESLIGLETFVHLESLNLSGNPIDDISIVSRFPDLRELFLSNIPGLADIAVLLEQGQLTTVDLSGSGAGRISCPDLDALGGAVVRPGECRKSIAELALADPVLQSCVADSMLRERVTFLDELTILNCGRRDTGGDPMILQLDGIQVLENLEVINLDIHKEIQNYSPLADMLKLKRLDLGSSDLRTLDVIATVPNLEVLLLKSASRLYRDDLGEDPTGISILASMPALREVYLDEKDYCPAAFGPACWTGAGRLDCATLDSMEGLFEVYVRPAGCNMPLADALAEVPDPVLRNCLQTQATNEGWTDTQGFDFFDECRFGGVTDLSGMENFSGIVRLDLSSSAITDLAPLNNIRTLLGLRLNNTAITSFDALTNVNQLRTISADNIPGLTDISELLRMRLLGRGNFPTAEGVSLEGSGNFNIACDALELLEEIVIGNAGAWNVNVNCGGPPAIPPTEGRLVDLDGDSSDDLVFQFDAAEGVPLTASWTTALGKAPAFDEFSNLPGFDTAIYSRARAIALADANNDGIDDLLLQLDSATNEDIFLQVWLNDEDGNFTTGTTPLLMVDGALNNAQAVAFTDVDQDGYADILIQWQETLSGFSSSLYNLFLGNGSSFESLSENPFFAIFDIPTKGRPRIIALEDVNNDSYPDLVYVNESIAVESEAYYKYCFSVMPWNPIAGSFSGSGSGQGCTEVKVPPRVFLESVSVADLTGNGNKEVVLSFNRERNLARIGDVGHFLSMLTLTSERGVAKWSGLIELTAELAAANPAVVTNFRTVAVADINNDRLADFVIEKELVGTGKLWITYVADTSDGSIKYVRDAHPVPFVSNGGESMAIGLLDYDDTDLQNLPDLLFRRMNVATGTYEVLVAVNNGTSFEYPESWYLGNEMPGIIGLEEDGLTALANDKSELIAWAGDTRLQTFGQFSEWLLLEKGYELVKKTVLDLDPNIKDDKCVLAYGDADASAGEAVSGFNQYSARSTGALLACNFKSDDGRLELQMQAVYGGCAVTAGVAGIGGKCEYGLFKGKAQVILVPEPELGVDAEISAAKSSLCAEVTLTNLCAGAEYATASASVGAKVGGIGASTGVTAGGLGGTLQAGWQDGAITATVGAQVLFGVKVQFSVNPEKVVDSVFIVGETSYTWGNKAADGLGDAGEFVIYTAGPKIYSVVSDGANQAGKIAKTAAGSAVKFFDQTENEAENVVEQVFVVFEYLGDEFFDQMFDDLAAMADDLANGNFPEFGARAIGAANNFLNAANSVYKFLF